MKKYRILKPVMLSFLTPQEQCDLIIDPSHPPRIHDYTTLESDGNSVWVVRNGKRYESITTANVIEYLLEDGAIVEIPKEETKW